MAEGKKSFIAYSDWNGMFEVLPDEIAGKLIKHIFAYVNDKNPETNDYIINALFEQIKATLKRDLIKWDTQRSQRSEAGKKSAELRALTKSNERSISFNEIQRNPTVSVSVNVNDILKGNERFFSELIISESWLENTAMQSKQKFIPNEIKSYLKKYNDMLNVQFEIKNNKTEYCTHFINWLNKQEKKSITKKTPLL